MDTERKSQTSTADAHEAGPRLGTSIERRERLDRAARLLWYVRADATVRWLPKGKQPETDLGCDLGQMRRTRSACGSQCFARKRNQRNERQTCFRDDA